MTKAVCLSTTSKSLTNAQVFVVFKRGSSGSVYVCKFCKYINVTLQFKWSRLPLIVIFTFGVGEWTHNSSCGHLPKQNVGHPVLSEISKCDIKICIFKVFTASNMYIMWFIVPSSLVCMWASTFRRSVHFLQMEAIYSYLMLLTAYNMTGSRSLQNCNIS
jgi:hypothetical protein